MSVMPSTVLTRILDGELGRHQGSTGWLAYPCPFCQSRKGSQSNQPKLRVNVTGGGGACCYRCNFRAAGAKSLLKQIQRITGVAIDTSALEDANFPRLATHESLYSSVLSSLYPENEKHAEKRPRPLPEDMVPIEKCHKYRETRRALFYLQKRHVTVAEAKRFEVGFCADGEFAQRLIFPIRMFGKVVYHTNRFVGDHKLKSKNPKNIEGHYAATDCLGNFDRAFGQPVVYIVEGPFDGLSRPDDGLFTMGKNISEAQVCLLEFMQDHGTREFVILRDSDADGYETYRRCAGRLTHISQVKLKRGDPFSRRHALPKLIKQKTEPTVFDSVRQRLAAYVV